LLPNKYRKTADFRRFKMANYSWKTADSGRFKMAK
jgi:hypothetical protein